MIACIARKHVMKWNPFNRVVQCHHCGEIDWKASSERQIKSWAKGKPIHLGDRTDGQCCPDFSCCRGDGYMAPEAERLAFLAADDDKRHGMMLAMLAHTFPQAYVTG